MYEFIINSTLAAVYLVFGQVLDTSFISRLIIFSFLILFPLSRFLIEYLRVNETVYAQLTFNQITSLVIVPFHFIVYFTLKKIYEKIFFILLFLTSKPVFSFSQDTINIFVNINDPVELEAPQMYYKYYNWIMPSGSIINNETFQLTFPNQGSYLVKCAASDDCSVIANTVNYLIHVESPSQNVIPISEITIYPNPIEGQNLFVSINSNINNLLTRVTIINEFGLSIYNSETSLNLGLNQFNFSELIQRQNDRIFYLTLVTGDYRRTFRLLKP